MPRTSFEELEARVDALCASGARRILGLAGPPGAGKSTLAKHIVERMAGRAVLVPMDGFHLANSELQRLGRRDRKGAPDTFDSAGYVALLERLRGQADDTIVYAPEFRRDLDESIGSAIPVLPTHRLIVTEGNYLLLEVGDWAAIRELLDQAWFVELDPDVRLQRLIARHVQYGRDEQTARAWVQSSDEPNAILIESTRGRADAVLQMDGARA